MAGRRDMTRYKIIFILLAWAIAVDLKAQADFHINYLNIDNGLSQGEITGILQDRLGFMWFATRGGLNKYDGDKFKIYKHNPRIENSLPNSSVEVVFEDSRGDLWIGTKAGGLSRFVYAKERFINFHHHPDDTASISEKRIVSIAEDHEGNMWFGTFNKGVNRYIPQTNSFKKYFPQERITEIFVSSKGDLWISVSGGLAKYDKKTDSFKLVKVFGNEYVGIVDIEENIEKGIFYLATWGKGLLLFNPATNSAVQVEGKTRTNEVISAYRVLRDRSGATWVGSWGSGLYMLNERENKLEKVEIMPSSAGAFNVDYDIVLSLFEDRTGIIWVGTDGGGICKIDKNKPRFNKLVHSSGLSNSHILTILADSKKNLWIGTKGGGLNLYKNNAVSPVQIQNTVNRRTTGVIKVVYEDRRGVIWIGTDYGLHKINGFTDRALAGEVFTLEPGNSKSVSGNKITVILEDSYGNFWVGTQQHGLNRLTRYDQNGKAEFKRYPSNQAEKNAFADNRVSCIYEDPDGRIWIGSYGGLHLYDRANDAFIRYGNITGNLNSISSNIITSISSVGDTLWVGTPNGLNKGVWDADGSMKFTAFYKDDGLPDDYIHAILYDGKHQLWISTNGGISCYDLEKNNFTNYNISDGLPGNAFSESAAFKKDGVMYFGGVNGLVFFHPDSIVDNNHTTDVVITDFRIFNRPVETDQEVNGRKILTQCPPLTRSITLSHRENVFTIEFASLDYSAPEKNNYAYRLEGFDDDWIYAGADRTVTYTNLRHGDYQLKIKSANSSNVWNERPTTINIKVLPPPWKSWWAYVIYIVVAFLLITLVRTIAIKQTLLQNNLRIAQLERDKQSELNETKSRFFTNVSHEFRTPLTLILGPLNEMLSDKKIESGLKEKLGLLHQHAGRLLHLVNQLLDFRKAETGKARLKVAEGNIVRFLKEIFLSFKEQARLKEINFSLEADTEELNVYFDRDKMEVVIGNLLSNAFKYTPEKGAIQISVSRKDPGESVLFEEGRCEIKVKDNGSGIPIDEKEKIFDRYYQIANADSANLIGSGIGLSLTKDYVELHHGFISVESDQGKGSEFIIVLPLGKDRFDKDQVIENFMNSENPGHYELMEEVDETVGNQITDDSLAEQDEKDTVLVVEDNPEVMRYLNSLLSGRGYDVMQASNGKEGWELAKENQPDLVISDLMMPEMDGLELCNLLKNHGKTSDIPVIILTARTASVFQVDGFQSGADDYITKPFNPETLLARVANLIRSRKQLKDSYSRKVKLDPTDVEITPYDEKILKKAVELVEQNMQNPDFSTQMLAEELNMSASTLYRKLKTLTGASVNEFVRSVRLKRAAQLLSTGEFTVNEAAYEVGIHDVKYFRNCFKKQYGVTPTQYQAEEKEDV